LVAFSVAGGLLFWLTYSPIGLLLPIVVLAQRFNRNVVFITCSILSIALLLALDAALVNHIGIRPILVSWGTFLVVAL
ncbi:hypothetical protein ACEQ6C_40460, partial [Rhizobium ruizarguesonis]